MTLRSLDAYLQLPQRRYFTALEWHAAAIGSIAALVLLGGYGFGIEQLTYLIPGFPTMRLNTAAALMALSLGYMLSLREARNARYLSIAIAAGIIAWLAWARLEWALTDAPDLLATLPADATIVCVMLSAVALLLLNLTPRLHVLIGVICVLAATPGLCRIFGLLLFWGAPDAASPLNSMALHTATLIAWFNLVCIALHPSLGIGKAILQPSLRGRLLRRALPIVIGLPVIAAALSLAFGIMLRWTPEALFALNATVSVVIGVVLVWWLSLVTQRWQEEATERAEHLARANEALEQYASSAAHDLKAPARHVLLYGELMEEALAQGDVEGARRHAKSIRASGLELPKLIDGMLEFSRSAHTRVSMSDTPLSEIVQAAAALHAHDLEAAHGRITLETDAVLRCDPALMTSLFQNLFGNAIKNRRLDRRLTIRVSCQREPELWRIAVEDNGVGFEPGFAAVAFNPLARGARAAGDGAGIGLAACRTIVQSHGGVIRIDQDHAAGARIEFTLPAPPDPKG
jgi:signal transduction histidine kinase